jgi:hypothetical protein
MRTEPKRVITHRGEQYVYVGDVPNTRRVKARELKNDSGRKVTFRKVSDTWVAVYVSKKFYPEKCNDLHPYHGTGTLR